MNAKRLTCVLGLAVASGMVWYFLWSTVTPNGQPPLITLTNSQTFATEFDRVASNAKMLLLLSPT